MLRSIKNFFFPPPPPPKPIVGRQQASDWYDEKYTDSEKYEQPYFQSIYYPLWSVVVDRLDGYQQRALLDLGCGPGQFASLLAAQNFTSYCGVDFSSVAIARAKEVCDSFEFLTADLTQSDLLATRTYDCIITMEFLEHVEEDLAVVSQIRAGTRVIATVPNFPSESHVRHFTSAEAVRERYAPQFQELSVKEFRLTEKCVFYLLDGLKT